MLISFVLFSFLIYGSLLLGHEAFRKGYVSQRASTRLTRQTIILIEPAIIILSFWSLRVIQVRQMLFIPLIASLVSLIVIFPALFLSARLHHHNRQDTGTYLGCAMFSNVGTSLGGFLCFLLLGEAGIALSIIYSAYFIPFFFTIGFAIANRYSERPAKSKKESLKTFFSNPVSVVPTTAVILGILLRLLAPERPEFLAPINKTLVYTSVVLYCFAIGITIRFRRIGRYIRQFFSMWAVKFLVSPVIGVGLGMLFGCHRVMEGLPIKVIFIETCMPVAIFSIVLSKLFDLNQDMANTCWILTTLAVIVELPVIYLIVNIL